MGTAQQTDTSLIIKDSLQEVIVQAFNYKKLWQDVPASIAKLGFRQLQQLVTTSLLPAINTIPGVRMEERSPASFRLSMRGSLLRSPFGIRNIKVYWNNLPLTDGGGNTYLNLIDATQLSAIEIAKGPTASMYGAGTGGLVLLETKNEFSAKKTNLYKATINGGSYGLLQDAFCWKHQTKNFSSQLLQSHQQSDGYRQQSASNKNNVTWTGILKTKHQQIDFISFYTRLYYQTPGGITLAQMQQNPKLARQAANGLPGAVQQHASIENNTFFVGVHQVYTINRTLSSDVAVVYNHTLFKNPFITNYEIRDEANGGFNAKLIYEKQVGKANFRWINGGEILANRAIIEDYGNRGGTRDTVQFKDKVYCSQWFVFSQLQIAVNRWNMQVGVSGNNQLFRYKRLTDQNNYYTHKQTDMVVMPRVSASYLMNKAVTVYGVLSKGFSPPSLAEIRPSNRQFNTSLQPEYGWNEEIGFKGGFWHHRLLFDINYYRFRLQNAIVVRNNTDGTQFFTNAGNTRQDGLEWWMQYHLLKQCRKLVRQITLSQSASYQPYRFISYQQGNNSYAGNHLTGVPENIAFTGLSIKLRGGYSAFISYTYTSSSPLSDANDTYAAAYHLLQTKASWQGIIGKTTIELFIGGDNLLNETYSLGNDINAAGKRYYNPAASINFSGGCKINW